MRLLHGYEQVIDVLEIEFGGCVAARLGPGLALGVGRLPLLLDVGLGLVNRVPRARLEVLDHILGQLLKLCPGALLVLYLLRRRVVELLSRLLLLELRLLDLENRIDRLDRVLEPLVWILLVLLQLLQGNEESETAASLPLGLANDLAVQVVHDQLGDG